MKWLLWEHCPVSIQKTTASVGLVTQKEAFDELPTEGSAEHNVLHRSPDRSRYVSVFLCEKRENMHMWASVGLMCKQKRTPWQCPVSGWCMRMWLRVNAWTRTQLERNKTSVTHTHTHSLARTAVADVVRIDHLTLYQRVLYYYALWKARNLFSSFFSNA